MCVWLHPFFPGVVQSSDSSTASRSKKKIPFSRDGLANVRRRLPRVPDIHAIEKEKSTSMDVMLSGH